MRNEKEKEKEMRTLSSASWYMGSPTSNQLASSRFCAWCTSHPRVGNTLASCSTFGASFEFGLRDTAASKDLSHPRGSNGPSSGSYWCEPCPFWDVSVGTFSVGVSCCCSSSRGLQPGIPLILGWKWSSWARKIFSVYQSSFLFIITIVIFVTIYQRIFERLLNTSHEWTRERQAHSKCHVA